MKPAIVLSTHNTGLGVIRSLGKMNVPIIGFYYLNHDMGYVSRYVYKSVKVPDPEKKTDDFINYLIKSGKEYHRSLLIPADDSTLVAISKFKKELMRYYTVACTEWRITKKFINKQYTYQIAETLGIPIPKTKLLNDSRDLKKYGKDMEYPCLLKPCQSHLFFEIFKRKMIKINNFDELQEEYNHICKTGLKMMLQEYIPGNDTEGINYNSYFWNHKSLIDFTAQKVRLSPPDSGVPCVVVSKNIPEVSIIGQKILAALNFYGFSCIEFKKDIRNGVYKLMEVNGRHNRSALLALKCGINFPYMEYRHLIYNELPVQRNYDRNVYWIDLTRDLIGNLQYLRRYKFSIKNFLTPYLNKHVFAVFDYKDIKPFLKRCLDILSMSVLVFAKFINRLWNQK